MNKRLFALLLLVFLCALFTVSSLTYIDGKLLADAQAVPVIQGEAVTSSRSEREISDVTPISNEPTLIIRRPSDVVNPTPCTITSLQWNTDRASPGQEVSLTAQGKGDCDQKIIYLSFYKGSQFLEELPAQFDKSTAQIAWNVPSSTVRKNSFTDILRTLFRTTLSISDSTTYVATTFTLVGHTDLTGDSLISSPPLSLGESSGSGSGEPGSGPDIPCSSISQYGITWNFASPFPECGQFANGDWYVVEPVTIVSKTPAQTITPGRNGDWINPRYNLPNNAHPYDDRLHTGALFIFGTYDPTLRPVYPLTFTSVTHPLGASLVSTVSQPTTLDSFCANPGWRTFLDTGTNFNQNCQRSPIKSAAILTILSTIPPADSFRPPYTGNDKTIQFTKNDLDYSVLGTLAPVGSIATYSLADIDRHIQRPNLQTSFWASEEVQPADNANGYGQFMAADISLAALAVNLNYPLAQKEPLVISLTQRGIDFYGTLMNTGIWFDTGLNVNWNQAKWYGLGGHGSGRMFPILFAGTLLNDTAMQDVGFTIAHDYSFGELAQTFTVKDYTGYTSTNFPTKDLWNCVGGGINCGRGGYLSTDLGLPEFGFAHFHSPTADDKLWLSGGNAQIQIQVIL